MPGSDFGEPTHAVRGPTDRGALLDFRDAFTHLEPLATGQLDDFLDPTKLHLILEDGVGDAETGRFDVVWTTHDDYHLHYTDDTPRNLRWDVHPNDYPNTPGDKHFHPPPDASTQPEAVEDSCIEVAEIVLVARAVHNLWRHAYNRGSFASVNEFVNPP